MNLTDLNGFDSTLYSVKSIVVHFINIEIMNVIAVRSIITYRESTMRKCKYRRVKAVHHKDLKQSFK